MDEDTEAADARLKSAVWFHTGELIDHLALTLDANTTPQFIAALAQLVFEQAQLVAGDAESFARHAGRKTIGCDDVLLCARKNDALHEMLKDMKKDLEREAESGGAKKRKENASAPVEQRSSGTATSSAGPAPKKRLGVGKRKT
ncbi:MHF histone-fold complex component [Saitoella coloradoensis]